MNAKLALTLAGAIALLVSGVFAGLRMGAPSSSITAEQETGSVFVPIEKTVLQARLIKRGVVEPASVEEVFLKSPTTGPAPLVTDQIGLGSLVSEGDVPVELNKRPLFAFRADEVAYRDLRVGDRGDDVLAVTRSLQRLGYLQSLTEVFTSDVGAALKALYVAKGYDPPSPTDEDVEAHETAVQEVEDLKLDIARIERETIESSVDNSDDDSDDNGGNVGEGSDGLDEAKVRNSLVRAEKKLAAAKQALQVWLPSSEYFFSDSLPSKVVAAVGPTGAEPEETLKIANSLSVVTVDLSASEFEQLTPSTETTVVEDSAGYEERLPIKLVASSNSDQSDSVIIELPADNVDRLEGATSVKVTFELGESEEPVFVAPVAAISSNADGTAEILARSDETAAAVPMRVETGIIADGLVEIRPADPLQGLEGVEVEVTVG